MKFLFLILFLLLEVSVQAASISHGFMVGHTTDSSTRIWTRTDSAAAVQIQYQLTGAGWGSPSTSSTINTVSGNDFTATFDITGLTPNTTYDYREVVDSGTPGSTKTFKTFKTNNKRGTLKIAWGADFKNGTPYTVCDSILAKAPDVMLWIGDNAYIDGGSATESLWWTGYKAVRDSHCQALTKGIANYAQWDDHDYGTDNSDSSYAYKTTARAAQDKYWPNPPYVESNASVYYSFKLNDIEFFVMDERWNRVRDTTVLGSTQDAWLKAALLASSARFKVLVSTTVMTNCSPTGSADYDAFGYSAGGGVIRAERDAIFQYIADNSIRNVFIISGDSHWIGAFFHPFTGAHIETSTEGFYEFNPTPGWADFVASEPTTCSPDTKLYTLQNQNAFGILSFDTTAAPGSVTVTLYKSEDGAQLYTRTIGEYYIPPAGIQHNNNLIWKGAVQTNQ